MSYLQKAKAWQEERGAGVAVAPPSAAPAAPEAPRQAGNVLLFPYPVNVTCPSVGGAYDPRDLKNIDGKPTLCPGWWRKIENILRY